MKYKPRTIEAYPFDGSEGDAYGLKAWGERMNPSQEAFISLYGYQSSVSFSHWDSKRREYIDVEVQGGQVAIFRDGEFSSMPEDKFHRKYELDEG